MKVEKRWVRKKTEVMQDQGDRVGKTDLNRIQDFGALFPHHSLLVVVY